MIRFLVLLVFIPVIVIIAAFAYRNAQFIKIDFFIVEYHLPLAAVILVTLFIGGALGFIANIFLIMSQKNKIRQLEKQRQTLSGLSEVLKSDK